MEELTFDHLQNHGGEVGSECDSYGGDRRGFVENFRR
jgi:hypothetical protein